MRELYARALVEAGVLTQEEADAEADAVYQRLVDIQQAFKSSMGKATTQEHTVRFTGPGLEVETALSPEFINALNEQLLSWPEGFTVHPKLRKQLERRRPALGPEGGIEWAHAETLALASLLTEGVPIRLTGQDTERGTFSQRHLVLHDVETGRTWAPIQKLPGALAPIELHNSPLSELATLGFEYGYSAAASEAMVLWEAQFGDFINGAQVIVDQFLSSGLVEVGPDHAADAAAAARLRGPGTGALERPAGAVPPARRRGQHPDREPDHAGAVLPPAAAPGAPHPAAPARGDDAEESAPPSAGGSRLDDLAYGAWRPVLDDPTAEQRRAEHARDLLQRQDLLRSAGRGGEDGRPSRRSSGSNSSTPSPGPRPVEVLAGYPRRKSWCGSRKSRGTWARGPTWSRSCGRSRRKEWRCPYVGRPERASPAEGYPAAHIAEQGRIVREALGAGRSSGRRKSPGTVAAAGEGKA